MEVGKVQDIPVLVRASCSETNLAHKIKHTLEAQSGFAYRHREAFFWTLLDPRAQESGQVAAGVRAWQRCGVVWV